MVLPDQAVLRYCLAGGFVAAALLAFAASRGAPSRDRRVWLMIGAALVLLGAAKLVRLQEALTGTLRAAAQAGGWYGFHREVQGLFAVVVGLLAIAGALFAARMLRVSGAALRIAAGALGALVVSLVVRAASIHAIDAWTTAEAVGMRRGWWLEAAAAALIAGCAAAYRGSRSSGS